VPNGHSYTLLAFGAHGVIAAALGRTLHMIDSASGAVMSVVDDAHSPVAYLQWSPVPMLTGLIQVAPDGMHVHGIMGEVHGIMPMPILSAQVRVKLTFWPQRGIVGCGCGGLSKRMLAGLCELGS
jgi:hypothetical protein